MCVFREAESSEIYFYQSEVEEEMMEELLLCPTPDENQNFTFDLDEKQTEHLSSFRGLGVQVSETGFFWTQMLTLTGSNILVLCEVCVRLRTSSISCSSC